MRKAVLLGVLAIGLLALLAAQNRMDLKNYQQDRTEGLVKQIKDKRVPASERDSALSSLEGHSFERAVELSATLLNDADALVRLRAAWILADSGDLTGLEVIKGVATERTEYSVIAMKMLGRLRSSHDLLRNLLEKELGMTGRTDRAPFISALTASIADFMDPNDAELLARAASGKYDGAQWGAVEYVGMTGGRDGVAVAEDIFEKGKGWTAMSAGLAAARCGSEKGIEYVRERLADTSGDPEKPNQSFQTDARTDDPHGPKATDFILSRMGVPADEIFVPDLLGIIRSPEYDFREKGHAWTALLKINPPKYRVELMKLAWENLQLASAVKLIVLNDESGARAFVQEFEHSEDPKKRGRALEFEMALSHSLRERRVWRQVHGYTF